MGINGKIRFLALFAVLMLLLAQMSPVIAQNSGSSGNSNSNPDIISPATVSALSALGQSQATTSHLESKTEVDALQNATTNSTDTDGDGLYDSVEIVLGTDLNNPDSDFDNLTDYYEAKNDLDPLDPDSNNDGMADYFEVTDVPMDVDGDGFLNQWDFDNDGDGVSDSMDMSPFSASTVNESFHFDFKTNGKTTYIDFQIIPQNPNNLRLPVQKWDWPDDDKGNIQDLDHSAEDVTVTPLLELSLSSPPDQSKVEDYGIIVSSNKTYVPLSTVYDFGIPAALNGRLFYPDAPLNLSMDAKLLWMVTVKNDKKVGSEIITENITLVKYYESFKLTGLRVEENYGADTGLFYSEDVNQTMAASFLMSYNFLRNNQTTLYDMPSDFSAHNLTLSSQINSFSHRDVALLNLSTNTTLNALDSLPDGQNVSMITAFQYDFVTMGLDDLVSTSGSGSHIMGNTSTLDLTAEESVTMKNMRVSWYNTSSHEELDTGSIVSEVQEWGQNVGLDKDNTTSMMALAIAWNVGETKITRIGNVSIDLGADESGAVGSGVSDYADALAMGILINEHLIDLIKVALNGKYFYTTFKALKASGEGFWKAAKGAFNAIKDISSKSIKFLKTASDVLGKIGFVIDIAFALLQFFLIAWGEGWSSVGFLMGTVYATAMIVFYTVLYVIAAFGGPVGAVIAGILVIIDLILSFFGYGFGDLISWLVGLFHQVDQRSDVDLQMVENSTSVTVNDRDNNGLDVGDSITIKNRAIESVWATSYGNMDVVNNSYVVPVYFSYVWGGMTYFSRSIVNSTYHTTPPYSKTIEYENTGDNSLNYGHINDPLIIRFNANYKVGIRDCELGWDFSWDCDYYYKTGSSYPSWQPPMYFDVVPGDINSFVSWRQITSLDRDGDGLKRGEDPWDWSPDYDGDGLGDKYEQDIGTDPITSDLDGDGLNDKMEIIHGTDPDHWDTDRDNLSDFMEITGWHITFNYSGQQFNMTVRSDPLLNDTDGDGVSDQMEYWSGLNPRSQDTNGDGVKDVAKPKYLTYVKFEKEWGSYGTGPKQFKNPQGIAVDDEGYVYVADTYNHRIQKFDSNGTFITAWGVEGIGDGEFERPVDIAVDSGFVYVAEDRWPEMDRVQKFDSNGTFITKWNLSSHWYSVVTASNGYVYTGTRNSTTYSVDFGVDKFDSNGTFITSWYHDNLTGVTAIASYEDQYVYAADGGDGVNTGLYKFDSNGTFIDIWGSEGYPVDVKTFGWPSGMAVDAKGFIYIADGGDNHLQKFAPDGFFITRWGMYGNESGNFTYPTDVAVDGDNYIYVTDGLEGTWYRVQKFSQITELGTNVSDTADTDGDGLTDKFETEGWNVTFTNATGTFTVHVTSEPVSNDTDFDGLNDYLEFNLSAHSPSNPRDVDTDGDGLNDFVEDRLGTNLTHYDTDGDGLSDGTEVNYGSDPLLIDTDGDGLTDLDEFNYNSDPGNNDTDGDGLKDSEEADFNSSLLWTDTDGDLMPDGEEFNTGANPNNNDTDGDNLTDGMEVIFNTSATNNDTDGDGAPDGIEVDLHLDPRNNDTDGDGLTDGEELEKGTDPRDPDTDGDGIPDGEDSDTQREHADDIILSYDTGQADHKFIKNLESYTNITNVTPEELLSNHSQAAYIVLVGDPGGNGTVGALIHELLEDSGDVLTNMMGSRTDKFAVRYGVWNSTQTVVMVSKAHSPDYATVLDLLGSMKVTKSQNSIFVEYPVKKPFFIVRSIDTLKTTDSLLGVLLQQELIPSVEMTRYNSSSTPHDLNSGSGLGSGEQPAGKYLEIVPGDNVQNSTGNMVEAAMLRMYYTVSDLDKNGDGDAGDVGDIDENKLSMYWFNGQRWTKLTDDMSWVYGTGVNTTDQQMFGNDYAGYLWANVTHFSTYGLAGEVHTAPAPPSPPSGGGGGPRDWDNDGLSDFREGLMGTDPENPDTDGDGIWDANDPEPLVSSIATPTPAPAPTPSPTVVPTETAVTPTPSPAPTASETATGIETPQPEEPRPGISLELITWIFLLLAALLISGYVLLRRRR